jgi:UDP-glucose 4-epimerase
MGTDISSDSDTQHAKQGLLPTQNILVTGGAGYVGSHLVDLLVEMGHWVSVIDDLSSGTADRLAAHVKAGDIRLIQGSILDPELLDRELRVSAPGMVFHLAAAVGVRRILADPLGSLQTNVAGTENVLRACAQYGAAVVLASSSEVYGRPSVMPMSESGDRVLGATTVPRWSYASAKALDEHLAFAYAANGLRVVAVRYFNSYGPRLDRAGDASVVGVFLRHALAGDPLHVHGDGRQTRCFTYVADTVRGTVLAAATPEANGQVFNIGSATETSIRELADLVVAATGSRSPIRCIRYQAVYGERFEDIPRRVPDLRQAWEVLGWKPEVSLTDGIERTLAWWRKGQ